MEDIDRNRARWSLTLSDRVTSSLSVGREREEVGPGTKAIHQDPDFRATGRARSEFSCPGILMLSSVLFFFFVSSSSSTFSSLSPPPLLRSSLVHHSTSTGVSSLLIRSTFQSSRIKPRREIDVGYFDTLPNWFSIAGQLPSCCYSLCREKDPRNIRRKNRKRLPRFCKLL